MKARRGSYDSSGRWDPQGEMACMAARAGLPLPVCVLDFDTVETRGGRFFTFADLRERAHRRESTGGAS